MTVCKSGSRRFFRILWMAAIGFCLSNCGQPPADTNPESAVSPAVTEADPPPTESNGNSDIADIARAHVQEQYSRLQPTWFEESLVAGNCEQLLNHPDWNTCMATVSSWMSHQQNPALAGMAAPHVPLLDNVSTQSLQVNRSGSNATVLVSVAGTCRYTDVKHTCANWGDMPRRPFKTNVLVTLKGSGLIDKEWQVTSSDEDQQAARERKDAWDSEFQRRTQAQQTAQNQLRLNQELIRAVDQKDQAAALRALDQGADPNATAESSGMASRIRDRYADNSSSLHLAIGNFNVAMVRLLLERSADPNQRGPNIGFALNVTPIGHAYRRPGPVQAKLEIISLLMDNGADPNLDGVLMSAEQDVGDERATEAEREWSRQAAAIMRR